MMILGDSSETAFSVSSIETDSILKLKLTEKVYARSSAWFGFVIYRQIGGVNNVNCSNENIYLQLETHS